MNSTTTLHKTIFKKFEQICPNTTKNQCSCIIYETGGYLIPREKRLCNFCKLFVEDEKQFVLYCSEYDQYVD